MKKDPRIRFWLMTLIGHDEQPTDHPKWNKSKEKTLKENKIKSQNERNKRFENR